MDPLNQVRNETPIHFFSPLKKNLTIQEFNDKNELITYNIPSMEISTHPKYLADILIKHLIDGIINERGLGYVTPEKRQEIKQEVEVTLDGGE